MAISGDTRKFKTLIVEDNGVFRQTFKETLQNRFPSMVIQEAAEGSEILQKMDAFRPEVIFMDIRLPGANGLELTRKIMASNPGTLVIILTDYDIPEYRKAAVQSGASGFFAKDSLDWGQLEAVIKSQISR
jgi:DNA-binding NarL/FixJ family response regulator